MKKIVKEKRKILVLHGISLVIKLSRHDSDVQVEETKDQVE